MTPVSTVTAARTLFGFVKVMIFLPFLVNTEYTRLYISDGDSILSRKIGMCDDKKSRYLT
jgi:hypothetical protein